MSGGRAAWLKRNPCRRGVSPTPCKVIVEVIGSFFPFSSAAFLLPWGPGDLLRWWFDLHR